MSQPKHVHDAIRSHLLKGLPPLGDRIPMPSPDEIRRMQTNPDFIRLCQNRMTMGAFRYGDMHGQKNGVYDNVASMIARLQLYQKGGNLEHLVDVANMCMIEFTNPGHPDVHFEAGDDSTPHSEKS